MSLINISNLTFAYDSSYDDIFTNVSFQIDTNWKLGFTGRNGRGKTTFLNLLLGKYKYSGSISSSVTFDYFPFEVYDETQNTIDVIDTICIDYQRWQLQRELSLLEVCDDVLYRPFNTLSNGEQTKVMLASLFLKENNFLLIDEPTNHLDSNARIIVSDYLSSKKGFILVSHDRIFLDKCIDHILSINKTNIEIQNGNFSSWYYNKQLQDNYEIEKNENLKKDIKRLEFAAKQKAEWSDRVEASKIGFNPSKVEKSLNRRAINGEKSRKMMKRSKVIESHQQNAIVEKSKLLKNIETADRLSIKPLNYHTNRLVELCNVDISYSDKVVCENINFTVERGQRIALKGKNGCGKSSILKLLIGEKIDFNGNCRIGSNLIISYISQDTSFLKGNLKDFAEYHQIDESLFKAILNKLDFSKIQFEKDISNFSGGQKKKVLIAKSLCEKANVYIWDEPLNFIDVLSRIQIEKLILEYKPTMIFVEHDEAFINNIATKIISL